MVLQHQMKYLYFARNVLFNSVHKCIYNKPFTVTKYQYMPYFMTKNKSEENNLHLKCSEVNHPKSINYASQMRSHMMVKDIFKHHYLLRKSSLFQVRHCSTSTTPAYALKKAARTSLRTTIGVHEVDTKGGYGKDHSGTTTSVREGVKIWRNELKKWQAEVKRGIAMDPLIVFPGEGDTVWEFDGSKSSPCSSGHPSNPCDVASMINPITSGNSEHSVQDSGSVFDGWIVTTDKDNVEGYSKATLTTSPAGHALFTGVLDTTVPKDGLLTTAGYCNMRCLRPTKSFLRESFYNWHQYTHFVIRCRGDGRSYMINLGSAGSFDVSWNDMFNYVLYTRGGPHWQTYRVPFSRFMLTSKGYVQDKQGPIDANRVTTVGITVGDKINAPFNLEIDYIGVEFDPIHNEEFAYELYHFNFLYVNP